MIHQLLNYTESLISTEPLISFGVYELEKISSGDDLAWDIDLAMLARNQPVGAIPYIFSAKGKDRYTKIKNGLIKYKSLVYSELVDLFTLYPNTSILQINLAWEQTKYSKRTTLRETIKHSKSITNFTDVEEWSNSALSKLRYYKRNLQSFHLFTTDLNSINENKIEIKTSKLLLEYAAKNPYFFQVINDQEFEFFIAELLDKFGYKNISVTPKGKDSGVDIYAEIEHKLGRELMIVQCKKYSDSHKISETVIKQLLSDVELKKASKGLIATTTVLTKPANSLVTSYSHKLLSLDKHDIRKLIDKDGSITYL